MKKIKKQKTLISGFKGYLLSEAIDKTIILRGINPNCELKVTLPPVATIKKFEN